MIQYQDKMSLQQEGYNFVIVPKYLQAKGFIVDKKLPQFSLSTFIANHKIDEITIVPVKEQKLYHTVFWLVTQRLQFVLSFKQEQWELVRLQIHDENQLIGKVFLNCKEYVRQLEQEKQHYHCQKVKISGDYELQFELFITTSKEELDSLLIQYYGESDIKTPITKQSQERLKDQLDFNIDHFKISQSEIYNPTVDEPKKSIFQRIDQQQSINSSVPQTYPYQINRNSPLKIQLKQISPQREGHNERQYIFNSNQLKKANSLTWRETLTLYFFGLVSLVMIYASMIPMKKI